MPHSWEISSQTLQRHLSFDPARGLVTTHFIHLRTGTDLVAGAEPSPEFDFCVDGQRVTSLGDHWRLLDASTSDPAWPLVLTLRHTTLALEIQVSYRCQASRSDKKYRITNTGGQPITLTRLAIESLPVGIATPGELQLNAHYGSQPRETFITGRVDDCAVVFSNPRTGEKVFALNEAPGHVKRVETGAWFWEGFVRLLYDTDLFPLEMHLAPGESWETALASLVLTCETPPQASPRWVLPAAIANILPKPGQLPAWHFNTWDPFGTGINETTVLELIPIAARMGFEIFTIDDGWQSQYGHNTHSPDRFPNGLEHIRSRVEAHGMRLGLWAPLSVVDPALVATEPSLAASQCRDAHGQVKTTLTAMGEQVVMCLASEYRQQAAARLIDLVERYHLAYLKLDLTTVFNAYGEAPGCHAPGHEHATAAESVVRIYEAIAAITAAVYARHPELLIDLTFELWGQKHTVDYGLLRAADLTWLSNVGDNSHHGAGPRQARTLLYQRSLVIPVETLLIGNLRAETGDLREKIATALGSCPLLLGDLRQLSAEQIAWAADKIRWHKALRREIDLSDSFFPLGNWQQPGVVTWDGFARLSQAGEGLIVLFRNESGLDQAAIQLPLPGSACYRLTSILDGATLSTVTADEFRAGLVLPLGTESIQIFEVRRIAA